MITSAIEQLAGLTIGSVESVSPSEIKAQLDLDAPQATALNTGVPTAFPRLNSYVLLPNESGAVVGQITWVGIERSAFPKRTGFRDFGLIDLPFPTRKITISPVGTLRARFNEVEKLYVFRLERGVATFPRLAIRFFSLPPSNCVR